MISNGKWKGPAKTSHNKYVLNQQPTTNNTFEIQMHDLKVEEWGQ